MVAYSAALLKDVGRFNLYALTYGRQYLYFFSFVLDLGYAVDY